MSGATLDRGRHRGDPPPGPAPRPTPDPHALTLLLMRSDDTALLDVLAPLLARPEWQALAACRGVGPNQYFPHAGDRPTDAALARCATCPVADQCAKAGARERSGWWAGRPARRRRKPQPR